MARFFKVNCEDDLVIRYINRDLVTDITVSKKAYKERYRVSYGLAATDEDNGPIEITTVHLTLEEALAEAAMVAHGDPGDECTPDNNQTKRS